MHTAGAAARGRGGEVPHVVPPQFLFPAMVPLVFTAQRPNLFPSSQRGHRAVLGTHPGTARGDGSTASLTAAEGLQRGTEARLCSQRGGEMQQRHSALQYGT